MMVTVEADLDGFFFRINKAVDGFGVPKLTLKDRLSGKVVHDSRHRGRRTCQAFVNLYQRQGSRSLDIVHKAVIEKRGTKDSTAKVCGINF